ncbi:helix-turn-helix domain-containing protein [Streptomyces adelaidensis]|uniref:helix-turn-helix domain-containing protein n=1 Tax=Streptomyces adelaidensis TaxID=2796465 RepID=UPI001907745F|nr:helix-turn-helix transcriptional regulator [Streptomyces adelaidensis]
MTADADALMRLGNYVERRIAELGLEYAAVCRAGGFSDETLSKIRKGAINARPATYHKLGRALAWSQGSIEAILSGGEPTPLPTGAVVDDPAEPHTERPSAAGGAEEVQAAEGLSPGEALRRVVRASARELGVTANDLDEVFQAVRDDLEETPSGRTDLSDLVRVRRAEAGLSLEAVAASTVDRSSGERLVEADWLDRLERAVLSPAERPEYPQLDALADALGLDPGMVQEAAGVQFMDVHTVWSDDGQVRAVVTGELDAEDLAKVHQLMRLYRRSPKH